MTLKEALIVFGSLACVTITLMLVGFAGYCLAALAIWVFG